MQVRGQTCKLTLKLWGQIFYSSMTLNGIVSILIYISIKGHKPDENGGAL